MSSDVAPLHVADEAFLVATTIERCPKTMMVRELFMNALEAATRAPSDKRIIEIRAQKFGNVEKLSFWNTGPGMNSEELHMICDIAASLGKDKDLDGNFGMGAKVASLPSNRFGMRYRSNASGIVSEIILGEREGIYGRLRRPNSDGTLEEVFDVTQTAVSEGLDLSEDWTEVVLFGNRPDQNTVRDPYDGNPIVNGQWLADYVYYRFFRLPAGVVVRFMPGTHKLDGTRTFRTIPERAYPLGQAEPVQLPSGVRIHYFYDPPLSGTSHNKSVSGAITSDVSTCAVVYKNEMYDLKRSRQWTLDAPLFGIPFGAKHISVHIELPDDAAVRPEAYRQFLRYRSGDQRQVESRDFADIVRENRPQWLLDVINSYAPADAGGTDAIRDELQKLLDSLRIRRAVHRLDQFGSTSVNLGDGQTARSAQTVNEASGGGSGGKRMPTLDDLLAVPEGAKKSAMSIGADRVPEIILLRENDQIEEKGLKGKAAKLYRDTGPGQLFINMNYPSIASMREQLEAEYASSPDLELMRRMAAELAERSIVSRIGRAVIFALAKNLNSEWTNDDVSKAHSPESLTLAADDYMDGLQNARRRLGLALRIGRNDSLQLDEVD